MKGDTAEAPRKRQRTEKQPAQRKRGSLSHFMTLPTDLFTMIVSHLLPLDILFLARSNKFFHTLLMTKSSRHIWLDAMKNVEGLPPCPSNMSEPEYVALLYTNVCSACGSLSRSPVDEYLLVRFCARCQNDELMRLPELPEQLHELVHSSAKRADVYTNFDPQFSQFLAITIRDEATAIWTQHNELAKRNDKTAFDQWVEQRKCCVVRRREFGAELAKFTSRQEAKRNDEKQQIIKIRRDQVKDKLLELGWEARDMKFRGDADGVQAWDELVEIPKQPKPLTDRTWKNLYKKLEPLLEMNREAHRERGRLKRSAGRRACLENFLTRLQHKEPPLLKVKPRQAESSYQAFLIRRERAVESRDVFPFVTDALEWPFVRDMNDEDPEIKDFRIRLEEHRSEIDAYIAEWQDEKRTFLVNLLREEDIEYHELLQPPKNTDPSAFARLSDDHKLLLRADSLFSIGLASKTNTPREAMPYDRALRTVYPSYPECPTETWELEYEAESPDLDLIHRHGKAQAMARILLADLGKPNASFVEINQLHYTCERCHDREPMGWTSIIGHYLAGQRTYARIRKDDLAREGITYTNVHDPLFDGGKPMIKPSRPEALPGVEIPVRKCNLCAKKSIHLSVVISEPKIHRHLLEVHNISDPKLGVQYHIPTSLRSWDHPELGYEYEAEDGEIEEVEADNEPEKEEEEVEPDYTYLSEEETDSKGEDQSRTER
ncbi:unnamed protein product [Rhizoctonia solani]|uniref:F-box domain-containing protein n=1 Tax=Rhizoctonia solani TaxID=456999 RepID=A0A8H3C5L8_9AGAM|nr:unnamed protein product [Rhizoctonia solani]